MEGWKDVISEREGERGRGRGWGRERERERGGVGRGGLDGRDTEDRNKWNTRVNINTRIDILVLDFEMERTLDFILVCWNNWTRKVVLVHQVYLFET
jgi:hypothetical protein